MWKFKKLKKKMGSVMVYKKITELSKQYMIYNAVTNERKWEDKKMDCDNEELEATKKMREEKCDFCDLKAPFYNSEAKIYELNGIFRITTDEVDTKINYCPICR